MRNSGLVCHTNLSPNRTSPRQADIDTITIHCMACDWTVERCGAYFATSSAGACSHYGVGSDGRIAQYCDEDDRAWCSSNGDNDHRAVTIEVACTPAHPYTVTDTALASLVTLCADICQRNGIEKLLWEGDSSLIGQIDRQNMTVHRWFAAKACPGDYLYNLHGDIAAAVNLILEEDTMDLDTFKALWLQMRQELQDNDSNTYSHEAREWAVGTGLISGGGDDNMMWEDLLTREQFVTVLYRYHMMTGGA